MRCGSRLFLPFVVLFLSIVRTLAQEAAPDESDRVPSPISPRQLLQEVPARLGGEFIKPAVTGRDASDSERRAAAAMWLSDVFAPIAHPPCVPVLAAFGRDPRPPDAAVLGAMFPAGRPIAMRTGEALLVPSELPNQVVSDAEYLSATGVLPFEVALTGEWARCVGAARTGPPARDPLLRLSRAARLEGVARLAGIFVALQGSGVSPSSLGSALMQADSGRSGWPQTPLRDVVADPVARALLITYFEDGLRWATVQFLSGRWAGLMASLEKPGVGPEALLGARPTASSLPVTADQCRLGPRGAVALLAATAQPGWLTQIISDISSVAANGAVLQLQFDSAAAAERAATEIREWGYPTQSDGTGVTVRPRTPDSPAHGS